MQGMSLFAALSQECIEQGIARKDITAVCIICGVAPFAQPWQRNSRPPAAAVERPHSTHLWCGHAQRLGMSCVYCHCQTTIRCTQL